MRKTPALLVIILIALWIYTCWYWYTCKIKWFCPIDQSSQVSQEQDDWVQWSSTSPIVTIQDTQTDTPVQTTQEDAPQEQETQTETSDISTASSWGIEPENCEDILTQAISLWGANDEEQVKNLENFLNRTQWESLDVDGRYSQDDFDAVKRFQEKYRQDILDPWDITSPTGYVYTTTIKKVNEVNCAQ